MTKARNLSKLLVDSSGDVESGSLDNVPASDDASALTTGTLPNERLASGAAVANLGYTPVNKAGDTMTGQLTIDGANDATPFLVTSTNSGSMYGHYRNTSSGVQYVYHRFESDNGSGYVIHNGTGTGNGLPSGQTYLWSETAGTSLVPGADINKRLDVATNGDVTVRGKVYGSGMVLLGKSTWTSNTTGAIFNVFDSSRFTNYVVYWYVNHSPNWNITALRFRNSSGDISSTDYYNNTQWRVATASSTPTFNESTYAGNKNYAWMAGNGTPYNSQGQVLISVPRDGSARASIRGMSQLIYRSSSEHYEEHFASTLHISNPHTALTGIHIYGTGGSSSYADIAIFGIER